MRRGEPAGQRGRGAARDQIQQPRPARCRRPRPMRSTITVTKPVACGVAGVGPAVLVDPDHPHPVQPGRADCSAAARSWPPPRCVLIGVPGSAQLAGHRSHRDAVDDQAAQHVPGAPPVVVRARRGPAVEVSWVKITRSHAAGRAAVARDPHPQLAADARPPADRSAAARRCRGRSRPCRSPGNGRGPRPTRSHHTTVVSPSTAASVIVTPSSTVRTIVSARIGHGGERRLRHRAPGGC